MVVLELTMRDRLLSLYDRKTKRRTAEEKIAKSIGEVKFQRLLDINAKKKWGRK